MKVALCLSGHMRSYSRTAAIWKTNIIDPLNADVFISTWNRKGPWVGNFGRYSDANDPGTIQITDETVDQKDVFQTFRPRMIKFDDYFDKEPEFIEKAKPAIEWRDRCPKLYHAYKVTSYISQFYKWFHCNALKKAYEQNNNFTYDLVIRSRPDLRISTPLPQEILRQSENVYVHTRNDRNNPVWVNDQFIVANSSNMDIITNIYPEYLDKLEEAKRANTPHLFFEIHTILWNHIQQNKLNLVELPLHIFLVR